ncbi:hydrogen peroxide-inducible genes activator [Propionivibrio sp.]|uniref:hydrogen peroxide-inducible genes activator n=1 Tax=Propionivibrio sp. TaxID=2212460 RepID=UPI0025E51477|nr:hydrogen peroxide-inducible genes activator [Propionivibrio sp.]MBK7354943.1 hydrogen peroxide-inducible genes activator [Propionivibrio sp.]MBK8402312.1 hydrogen peroxide-inducible genes activator [Propionivibrio sp.]MBK8743469.1 hydrogen peroxide-inducible genes activator [Propionivibrio sp.]MBK8892773.1 hydrogen peroxide-inducible genes activator [Propionivibrio sp.]MBL0206573.1 hydrogen peroxide-inducible genes activator [Propionivibrio sp.]
MTLTELRYIVMLARERHFGRAAERCHVSQPTLSVAVKKVEHRLGVILFERSSADVRLTPIGEQIARQAVRVLEEAGRLTEIATQGKNPLVGPLRLGVIYTIAPYLLPRLIPALHIRAPLMPMFLYENFTVSLAEQLRRGDLDVIVVALPFAEPGIVSCAVYDEAFCVVMPAGHPLTALSAIPPDQVAAENLLLLGQGNCFRDQVVQACPQLMEPRGIEGALEGSSLETVHHMVASGAGISVVPVSAANSWPQNEPLLQFRHFTDPAPFRRVVIAWRATFPRPQAIDALRAAILDSPPAGVTLASSG